MHGRVDIAKGPFIGRQLAAGMHVALVEHQQQLIFGEFAIDQRHRNTMESQVPGGIPRILPRVGHEDHIEVREMPPTFITAALRWWGRSGRITPQPGIHIIVEELFTPEQTSQCLTLDRAFIIRLRCADRAIKFVCFCHACGEEFLSISKWLTLLGG